MKFAVFDIETRIDKGLLRAAFFADEGIDDEEAYRRMREQILAERDGRSDFLPLALHVPVSIVIGNVNDEWILADVETLGAEQLGEAGIVREFWGRLERFRGVLVSFNGRGFDLPVLELQALRHALAAPAYFSDGRRYRSRFAEGHYDLHEFLTNYGAFRIRGGFDFLAKLTGLPGKVGVDGSMVQALWETGQTELVHRYCRCDVIQTYLLLLHVERMRGRLPEDKHAAAWAAAERFRAEIDDLARTMRR